MGSSRATNGGAHWAAASAGSSPAASGCRSTRSLATPAAVYVQPRPQSSPAPVAIGILFKSINGGANWSQLDLGTGGIVRVTALAADPTNPRVLYAGLRETGQPFATGVLRSGDAGATWIARESAGCRGRSADFTIQPGRRRAPSTRRSREPASSATTAAGAHWRKVSRWT